MKQAPSSAAWVPIALAVCGALAAIHLARPLLSAPYQLPQSYVEGWNAYHALSAVSPGRPLYPGPDALYANPRLARRRSGGRRARHDRRKTAKPRVRRHGAPGRRGPRGRAHAAPRGPDDGAPPREPRGVPLPRRRRRGRGDERPRNHRRRADRGDRRNVAGRPRPRGARSRSRPRARAPLLLLEVPESPPATPRPAPTRGARRLPGCLSRHPCWLHTEGPGARLDRLRSLRTVRRIFRDSPELAAAPPRLSQDAGRDRAQAGARPPLAAGALE